MTYTLHPGAEHDVANALYFYSEHAGPVVAGRYSRRVRARRQVLGWTPRHWHPNNERAKNFPTQSLPVLGRISNSGKQYTNLDRAPSAPEAELRWW